MNARIASLLACGLLVGAAHAQPPGEPSRQELIARGDAGWAGRAAGATGDRAAPGPIGEAVAAYRSVLRAAPDDPEARWKLLRALYFQGEHVAADRAGRLAVYEQGRELAESGLDRIAARLGGRERLLARDPATAAAVREAEPHAARSLFWAAAHWGLWARNRGRLAAAREGVATKIRDYAEAVILLDERAENAGGHRVLGRLHAEAPRLPFITGWVDREVAVFELEAAVRLFPEDLLSRLYLAEALLEYRKDRAAEALGLLRAIVAAEPDPEWAVEDARTLGQARALLDGLR